MGQFDCNGGKDCYFFRLGGVTSGVPKSASGSVTFFTAFGASLYVASCLLASAAVSTRCVPRVAVRGLVGFCESLSPQAHAWRGIDPNAAAV